MENKTLSMITIVPIRETIKKLMVSESNSIAIQNLCKEYNQKLDNGLHEEQICEQFVVDLSKIADTSSSKEILQNIDESVKSNKSNIKLANDVYNLSNGSCMFVAPMIESAVADYIIDKNSTTRDNVKINLSLFESDATVRSILETLQYEQYEEKNGKVLTNAILKEEFKTPETKTYTQEEVDRILSDKVNEMAEAQKNKVKKTKSSIKSHIRLSEAITAILKDNKNEKLKVFCEQYINALNSGKPEELLYESFISGISNWNYLSAVDTELSALKGRVSQYKQDIDLKKILETMSQTGSYYIVPLIEDVVVDYVENKNMATRAILLQRLESFEYDPFVRDMECLITRDLSIENTVYLGESVEYLNNQVKTELVFSPVQYIKENECVFNVKGAYFARKGNKIAKLTRKEVSSLSESFKSLCNIVNADNVKFSKELNSITVYGNSNVCVITESDITLNGKEVTTDELKKLMESSIAMRSDDAEFYCMAVALNEHYNNIAYIDFVKRIESRDNSGKSCDVFKLKESIFVNTTNSNLGRSTFYRNVNPILCRKYINEHMEINCAPLFEDELPEQEKVVKGIEDKKKEYQDYIDSLEEKKKELQSMKDESDNTDDIDRAIEMIDKELDDTKEDFLKYQKDSDKYLNGDDDDADDSLDDEVPDNDDDSKSDNDTDNDTDDDNDDNHDELDPDKESPEDMEKPLDGSDSNVDSDDMADNDSDVEYADVAEFDADFDIPTEVTSTETEEGPSIDVNYGKFQIVKVSYNKNVKTGEENGKGEVILVIPSVDANGDVHDDMRKVTFYLDQDKTPVINNEYMPLDMYTQIVDAINSDPQTETITVGGSKDETTDQDLSDLSIDNIDTIDINDTNDTNDVVDTTEDNSQPKDSVHPDSINTEDTDTHNREIRETPAETQQSDAEDAKYPITVGLYPEEIAPIEVEDFEKDLDDKMKIEHTESEANDGEIVLKIANKAQAHALKKYFHEWKAYDDKQFCSFFPELQKCFANKPTHIDVMPANEGVIIKNVDALFENKKDDFRVMLPCNESLCRVFGITYDGNVSQFEVIPENKEDKFKIYESLYTYARKNNGNVEQDVIDVLEKYGKKYGKICESLSHYKITVPYNNFLKQKIESKGINVNESAKDDRLMIIDVQKEDYKKARKVLESFYGESAPIGARDFYQHIDENVTITVKDDATGKTIEINTDDLNGKTGESTNEDTADFNDSFKNVTFNPQDSLAFKDDDESADEDEKDDSKKETDTDNKDTDKKDVDDKIKDSKNESDDIDNKSDDIDDKSDDESKEEKPKKKFKFKAKKSKTDESLRSNNRNHLNESELNLASPNVYDYVICKDGNKGQVICKQADGNFIVNVNGHTLIYPLSDLKLSHARFDIVDTPFKYDESTLKGVYESYVNCGLFVNNTQVTPNDCKVQLLEYMRSNDEAEINLIIEGERTTAQKKYIRITESLNDIVDLANYAKGTMTYIVEGTVQKTNVLVNVRDFQTYAITNESTVPVRTLIFDDNGETHMSNIPGGNLMINEVEGFFKPESEKLMESAIKALS